MENSEEIKKLTFSYTLEDLFTRRLFVEDNSRIAKPQLRKSYIVYALILASLVVFNFSKDNIQFARSMAGILIIWLIAGYWFLKRYYKAHYRDFVRNHELDTLEKAVLIEMGETRIFVDDSGLELRFPWTELDRIVEIQDQIFLVLKNKMHIMIPKKGQDDHLPDWISALAEKNKVVYSRNFGWKW